MKESRKMIKKKKYAPSGRTSHFRNNLGTSLYRSSGMVSQLVPKIKKYLDFWSRKGERNPETTLDFLSQGKSSKYL